MGTGMSKVLDGLYLGNIRDSQDKDNLVKNGVSHVLSICHNAKPVLEDMTYLCIDAADSSSQNLMKHFKECIKFIHECRMQGGGCIVHCLAGVSRSTTVVVAYLMTVTDHGWEECLSAVKAARSFVSPNFGFQQQLQEFEVTLVKEYRSWLQTEYGENQFNDKQEIAKLLSQYDEQQKQQLVRHGERHWANHSATVYPLPYNAYGSTSHSWVNR
ncbi:dual specificity protein phosphatase 22-A [Scyliorhinus canicula]|uniref:dual specificity protein phosphatase 22-A n=1 Tax=Scyliorhinus canicula TaxID=7830 RepID=UPI0018F3203A|nr:dual specificity protein phosphatase 22-A [Scyliorhinus canicula]